MEAVSNFTYMEKLNNLVHERVSIFKYLTSLHDFYSLFKGENGYFTFH